MTTVIAPVGGGGLAVAGGLCALGTGAIRHPASMSVRGSPDYSCKNRTTAIEGLAETCEHTEGQVQIRRHWF
jgi:hypothetical protein